MDERGVLVRNETSVATLPEPERDDGRSAHATGTASALALSKPAAFCSTLPLSDRKKKEVADHPPLRGGGIQRLGSRFAGIHRRSRSALEIAGRSDRPG